MNKSFIEEIKSIEGYQDWCTIGENHFNEEPASFEFTKIVNSEISNLEEIYNNKPASFE